MIIETSVDRLFPRNIYTFILMILDLNINDNIKYPQNYDERSLKALKNVILETRSIKSTDNRNNKIDCKNNEDKFDSVESYQSNFIQLLLEEVRISSSSGRGNNNHGSGSANAGSRDSKMISLIYLNSSVKSNIHDLRLAEFRIDHSNNSHDSNSTYNGKDTDNEFHSGDLL